MLTSSNSSAAEKDLQSGGAGAEPADSLSSVIEPLMDASEDWVRRARNLANAADDFVRENPWQAIGVAALLSVTLGYVLGRRS
jgi:ElaB/YqjD/DUF883 family membrane-anchored ribosome-binding protein